MAFNVLIVDDSSTMRAVIKKTIKVSGFNVGQFLEAGDGATIAELEREAEGIERELALAHGRRTGDPGVLGFAAELVQTLRREFQSGFI